MKTKSENFESLKTFCIATLSFYCITFGLFVFVAICWLIQGGLSLQLYEICMMAVGLLFPVGALLSVLWFLITLIWCSVICKQEQHKKYFSNPIIIVNLILEIIFPLIVLWGATQ